MTLSPLFRERRAAAGIAFVLATSFLPVGWIVLRVYTHTHNPQFIAVDPGETPFVGESEINAYLLAINPFYDSGGQRLAHKCIVASVGLTVLLGATLRRVTPWWTRREVRKWAYIACITVWACTLFRSSGFELNGHSWKFGLACWILACLFATRHFRRSRRWIYAALCALLLAWAILPGLFRTPDLSSKPISIVAHIESHYSLVIGQVDRLAAGHHLLSEVQPVYGLFFHVLLSGIARSVGGFDIGNYVTFFQLSNAAYLIAAVIVFAQYARGRWGLILISTLMVVPWYHSQHECLWFPNHAAWRTTAFPLSFALMFAAKPRSLSCGAFLLGAFGATALLINFESGVACVAGQLTFVWFRSIDQGLRTRLGTAALYAAGCCVAVTMLTVVFRWILGYWLDISELWRVAQNALFWASSGFGGKPHRGDLFPVVMFLHAAYILIHVALLPVKSVTFRDAFRGAVAATILVWFAYYANRSSDWNLSSFSFLYAFLVMDLVRRVVVAFRSRWTDRIEIEPALCLGLLVVVVGPRIAAGLTWETVESGLLPPGGSPERQLVSGIYMNRTTAETLTEKAGCLTDEAKAQETMYVTFHSMFVPSLAGIHPPLPFGDAVTECYNKTRYEELLRILRKSGTSVIYFDQREAEQPAFAEFYWKLRNDLRPYYWPTRAAHGWEMWSAVPLSSQGSAARLGERVVFSNHARSDTVPAVPMPVVTPIEMQIIAPSDAITTIDAFLYNYAQQKKNSGPVTIEVTDEHGTLLDSSTVDASVVGDGEYTSFVFSRLAGVEGRQLTVRLFHQPAPGSMIAAAAWPNEPLGFLCRVHGK